MKKILLYPDGKRIYRAFHNLRRDDMDYDALKVMNRLARYGYKAYLVGGCVRDMLLKKNPKDYDIATNATPEQIRKIFTNSRLIGRRFRIVHIIFRDDKIIEVATFRSLPGHRLDNGKKTNKSLLIKRDNKYGSPQEDAARRDFTINGLYFDARNESIIDYVGGYEDIEKKYIQAVGDPNISFQEDPIRMLRAAKFAALLDFNMADKTAIAIKNYRNEILKANKSRLLEEIFKIFRTGKTAKIFATLYELELFKVMFPEISQLNRLGFYPFQESPLSKRLVVADLNLAEHEQLTINIYIALLLADVVREYFQNPKLKGKLDYLRKKILPICRKMMISHRDTDRLLSIYSSQAQFLENPENLSIDPEVFRSKVYFYEAFMYFKICAQAEENEQHIQKAMYWEIGFRTAPPERNRAINIYSKSNIRASFRTDIEDDFIEENLDKSKDAGDKSEYSKKSFHRKPGDARSKTSKKGERDFKPRHRQKSPPKSSAQYTNIKKENISFPEKE